MIWIIVVVLALGLSVSLWINVTVVRKNLALSDQREELVDQIEESLDQLDVCYGSLSQAANTDVFSDEPVVREVMKDIKRAKNAVLAIASKVVTYGQSRSVGPDDDE